MKRLFIMAVLAVLVATPAMSISVVNSKHDMIYGGFATGGGGNTEVCIFCHTPHAADGTVTQVPLWNNTEVANVGALYSNTLTMNFTPTALLADATDARMCLACHELGLSANSLVNEPNSGTITTPGVNLMSGDALLSTDLSNDHPIGMDLTANPENAGGMHNLTDIKSNFGAVDPFPGDIGNDAVNVMWCSSCHDVHDNAYEPFLRVNNVGSALCKACHIK